MVMAMIFFIFEIEESGIGKDIIFEVGAVSIGLTVLINGERTARLVSWGYESIASPRLSKHDR